MNRLKRGHRRNSILLRLGGAALECVWISVELLGRGDEDGGGACLTVAYVVLGISTHVPDMQDYVTGGED